MTVFKMAWIFLVISAVGGTFVSENGVDVGGCGVGRDLTACRTVVYACNQAGVEEIVLVPGNYTETSGATISGTLSITGESQSESLLSKTNDDSSNILFTVEVENANLTISNLTIYLVNHEGNVSYIYSNIDVTVFVTIQYCLITMQSGLAWIQNPSFLVNNTMLSFSIDNSNIYGIKVTAYNPFIYAYQVDTFCITNSSFANIMNSSSGTGQNGGCFLCYRAGNLTLSDSLFGACNGTAGKTIYLSKNGSSINSCVFWNVSAYRGGALDVGSDDTHNVDLQIKNTTCAYCRATYGGGVYVVSFVRPTVLLCNFRTCASVGSDSEGGGLYVRYRDWSTSTIQGEANVTQCTFYGCEAPIGAAMCAGSQVTVIVTDCIFLGNYASRGKAHDIYGYSSVTLNIVRSYSDRSSNVFCNGSNVICTDTLPSFLGAPGATCSTFSADTLENGRCPMPCAEKSFMCVMINQCGEGYAAISGVCYPLCTFFKPVMTQASVCSALCVPDSTLHHPLCSPAGKPWFTPDLPLPGGGACTSTSCESCDGTNCAANGCVWLVDSCTSSGGGACSSTSCENCDGTNCAANGCEWSVDKCTSSGTPPPPSVCSSSDCAAAACQTSSTACTDAGCSWSVSTCGVSLTCTSTDCSSPACQASSSTCTGAGCSWSGLECGGSNTPAAAHRSWIPTVLVIFLVWFLLI